MTQGERIAEVRKTLNLTLEKFGSKLGVTKVAVSNIERGNRNLTDQMAISICRTYNVNYDWLMYGDGDMFDNLPQTILEELCVQYELDGFDKSLVEMYVQFPKPLREYLKNNLLDILKKHWGDEIHEKND